MCHVCHWGHWERSAKEWQRVFRNMPCWCRLPRQMHIGWRPLLVGWRKGAIAVIINQRWAAFVSRRHSDRSVQWVRLWLPVRRLLKSTFGQEWAEEILATKLQEATHVRDNGLFNQSSTVLCSSFCQETMCWSMRKTITPASQFIEIHCLTDVLQYLTRKIKKAVTHCDDIILHTWCFRLLHRLLTDPHSFD